MVNKVVQEGNWLRKVDTPTGLRYESKLLLDRLPVRAEAMIAQWDSLSGSERSEFALALQARGRIDPDDIQLIDFLLVTGDSDICATIAPLLPQHPDKKRITTILLAEIREQNNDRANYFQALELMGNESVVPELTKIYDEMREQFERDSFDVVDFISCCRTLWKLTGNDSFRLSLEHMLDTSDEVVRSFARLALDQK